MDFTLCPIQISLQIIILEEYIIKYLKFYSQKNIQSWKKQLLNLFSEAQEFIQSFSPKSLYL